LKRLSLLVCEIVLVAIPNTLLAQRGVHRTGAGRPTTGGSNPAPSNSDMNDFNRAVALQAAPEQIARYQQLTKSMEAARKETQNLLQHAANASKADASRYAGLNDAVEEAQHINLQFVGSFSASQQSGLKPLIKKLSKADSDVSKQGKALTQELERLEFEGKKINTVVQKLDTALASFQSEQLNIGKEMGIEPEGNSQ
jgi:chromosome segregation ATPase